MSFLADQLGAVMQRSNKMEVGSTIPKKGDVVLLTLSSTVAVTALKEYGYYAADPMLGGVSTQQKIQLRFPASELKQAVFEVDFNIGDRCYIGPPVQLIPEGTFDKAKWELKYYRESADGLLITVGLDSDD